MCSVLADTHDTRKHKHSTHTAKAHTAHTTQNNQQPTTNNNNPTQQPNTNPQQPPSNNNQPTTQTINPKIPSLTAIGWLIATRLSARTAAKRSTGLEEERKSCSTVMAGASSRALTSRKPQIARAASKMTISPFFVSF